MKILYIITQAEAGGAQKYTLTLAQHFGGTIAAGHDLQTGGNSNGLFVEAKKLGIPCVELRHLKREIHPLKDVLAVREIARLIKEEQPDIVHLNSSKAGIVGSLAKIFTNSKIIFTAHGFVFNEPLSPLRQKLYLYLEKFASRFRDYIIAVSEADRVSAIRHSLIAPNKISTIHNGIAPIDFFEKSMAREKLGLPKDKIIIGALSDYYKTKGLDVLIEAVSKLSPALKERVEIFLPGQGPEFENLKLQIENFGLQNVIKLHPKIEEGSRYLKAYDVFVMPSRKEGLPFAILEAMQAGLAIIASNTGGIPEALGETGFLVEKESSQQLADTLSIIINDISSGYSEHLKQLSQKTQERAKEFSQDSMLEQTKRVYQKILNN